MQKLHRSLPFMASAQQAPPSFAHKYDKEANKHARKMFSLQQILDEIMPDVLIFFFLFMMSVLCL